MTLVSVRDGYRHTAICILEKLLSKIRDKTFGFIPYFKFVTAIVLIQITMLIAIIQITAVDLIQAARIFAIPGG